MEVFVAFVFSVLGAVCYLGLLLVVSNVVGAVCWCSWWIFVVYSLVCGSGIPFVGCDCMTVDVVDSCMHVL